MNRPATYAVSILLLGVSTFACGQEQAAPASTAATSRKAPSPEEIKKAMDTAFVSMVPTMVSMTEATTEAQLNIAAKPETAVRVAAFKRNLYLELQKQGFKPKEAMQIVLGTPLPSVSIVGK